MSERLFFSEEAIEASARAAAQMFEKLQASPDPAAQAAGRIGAVVAPAYQRGVLASINADTPIEAGHKAIRYLCGWMLAMSLANERDDAVRIHTLHEALDDVSRFATTLAARNNIVVTPGAKGIPLRGRAQ